MNNEIINQFFIEKEKSPIMYTFYILNPITYKKNE